MQKRGASKNRAPPNYKLENDRKYEGNKKLIKKKNVNCIIKLVKNSQVKLSKFD